MGPDIVELDQQLGAMWRMMMQQATGQGASRGDLILLTLGASKVILETTAEAMWPVDCETGKADVVRSNPLEHHGYEQFAYLIPATTKALESLGTIVAEEEGRAQIVEGTAEEVED